jgi:O-antigen biosynthesis protein WbqP
MALPGASVGGYTMPEKSEDYKVSPLKRIFDCVFASILLVGLTPLFVSVAIAIKLTSKGSILFWSDRVGRNNELFRMPKFRTMRMDTPQLATHLLSDPSTYLTPIGVFLRKTSLDELPQLVSILAGHLSLVGPRPALFNQKDLVDLRTQRGVHRLIPGITGWAQVNGRDELSIPMKVNLDDEYLRRRSFGFDLRILAMTALKVVRREGISH